MALPISLRLRLTLLYGVLFLAAGTALLGITYVLFSHGQAGNTRIRIQGVHLGPQGFNTVRWQAQIPDSKGNGSDTAYLLKLAAGGRVIASATTARPSRTPNTTSRSGSRGKPAPARALPDNKELLQSLVQGQASVDSRIQQANVALASQRAGARRDLLTWSGIALGGMALISVLLGWLVAGRALAPLRTMNRRARAISAENLHERLGLDGRRDELGDLAGTFDGLLARLEGSFEAQRRFVANASHELRTPVTLERALVEVALADPDASAEQLRATCERVLASSKRQEETIDALLALARGQAGIGTPEPVDIRALVKRALTEREDLMGSLTLQTALNPAQTQGDPRLLERLVANLLDNARLHNVPDGCIEVETGTDQTGAFLRVVNTGEILQTDPGELLAPFRRGDGERLGGGLGLGLSIVDAVVSAHGGHVTLTAREAGGLDVRVSLPTTGRQAVAGQSDSQRRGDPFAVQRAGFS